MDTSVTTTAKTIVAVLDDWRALGVEAGGLIEQPEWAAACLDAVPSDRRLRISTVVRKGRLVALAPMAVKRVSGVTRQVMLGVDAQQEPMNLLATDGHALATLITSLARSPLPGVFGRLPADCPSVPSIRAAFRGRGLVIVRPRAPTPRISLDDSWAAPERHLSPRRRSDLRRARRRAEQLGEVRAEILTPARHELDALLDEAFIVEARSWKGAAGTAIMSCPAEEALVRSFARRTRERGSLRVCLLRIDGRAVAMQIAAVHGHAFWLLKIGYDEDFSRCSPGLLLLRETIAAAAQQGLSSFEFLGRAEPWIAAWTSEERPTVSVSTYPFNLRGAAALVVDGLGRAARATDERATAAAASGRTRAKAAAKPALERVARRYLAGPSIDHALAAVQRAAKRRSIATVGFWNGPGTDPRDVTDRYLEALDRLAADRRDTHLAIKLPGLGMNARLLEEVADRAVATGRRIHVDSLGPDVAELTRRLIDQVRSGRPELRIGMTLPGRWAASVADADWTCERGLPVRVVKGEWRDPDDPERNARAGFLEVIDRLAGRAAHVGVATHDPGLAGEAIRRLQDAGTPCSLELLYGLPMRDCLRLARASGIDARVYVPYGHAYMPYALGQIRRRPRIALWLARDLAASAWGPGRAPRPEHTARTA